MSGIHSTYKNACVSLIIGTTIALGMSLPALGAPAELHIFMLDQSQHMSRYWDKAYADLVAEYEKLQAAGVIVDVYVFSNGTTSVDAVHQPNGAMRLEDRENHPVEGPKTFYDAQAYRAFGRLLDVIDADARANTNRRITAVFWTSGTAVETNFVSKYKSKVVLQRWAAILANKNRRERVAVDWRYFCPRGDLDTNLASFIQRTKHQPIDQLDVKREDNLSVEVQLPPGEGDRLLSTRPIRCRVDASPSLHSVGLEASGCLERDPSKKVSVGIEPNATCKPRVMEIHLSVTAGDLQSGENSVLLFFKPKLAMTTAKSEFTIPLKAVLPRPEIRVSLQRRGSEPLKPNELLDQFNCGDLDLQCSNVSAEDTIILTSSCEDAESLTVGLRPKDTNAESKSIYETKVEPNSPLDFDVVLKGKVPDEPGKSKKVSIRVETRRLATPIIKSFSLHIGKSSPDRCAVDVKVEPKQWAFLPGEVEVAELTTITLTPEPGFEGGRLRVKLADKSEELVTNRYCTLELQTGDATDKRKTMDMAGVSVDIPAGDSVAIKLMAKAKMDFPVLPGESTRIPLALVLTPEDDFSLDVRGPGEPYVTPESPVEFYGPAVISVSGECPRDLWKEVLVKQQIANPPFAVRNSVPGHPIPENAEIIVYLDTDAGQVEIAGEADKPGVTFDQERNVVAVRVPTDGQPIHLEFAFKVIKAGDINGEVVFDASAAPALSFGKEKRTNVLRLPLKALSRNPYVDINWDLEQQRTCTYGGQHLLEGLVQINGRALPGTHHMSVRLNATGLPEKSRLVFEPSGASAAAARGSQILLTSDKDVDWPLFSNSSSTVEGLYTVKLQVGAGVDPASAELTVQCVSTSERPLEITSGKTCTMQFPLRPPSLDLQVVRDFAPLIEEERRGWLGTIGLKSGQDWQSLFDNDWGQEHLGEAVKAELFLVKAGKEASVPNCTVSQHSDSSNQSMQGRPLKDWLTAGELALFAPAWSKKQIPKHTYRVEVIVEGGLWTGQESGASSAPAAAEGTQSSALPLARIKTDGELPPVPPLPNGWRRWLVPIGAILVLLTIATLIWIHLHPCMVGRLVREAEAEADADDSSFGFTLSGYSTRLGSSRAAIGKNGFLIEIDDEPEVLPRHAILKPSAERAAGGQSREFAPRIRSDGGPIYIDGSSDPTLDWTTLEDGMKIRLGNTTLIYKFDPTIEETLDFPEEDSVELEEAANLYE